MDYPLSESGHDIQLLFIGRSFVASSMVGGRFVLTALRLSDTRSATV